MNDHDEIKAVNERQKIFYEVKKKNFATRLWSKIRNGILNQVRKKVGVQDQIYNIHRKWAGNLSEKKVLDLGCYSGNHLSLYLARNSKEYLAIDLSESAINQLSKSLEGISGARAIAGDFLSDDFKDKDFDLIYAYGVLHHFKNTSEVISKLREKLRPNGRVISYDPLQTNLPVKIVRQLYRPFQTDKDWEWPFSKRTFYQYERSFRIIERRGVLGKAKWFFLINLFPLSAKKKTALGKKWHKHDWDKSEESYSHMFKCMHLTMLMQNKK